MNIAHSMSVIIQRSHSLTEILDSAVQLIAREMGTDVSSIYLIDPQDRRLRLMATHGLDKAGIATVTLAVGEGITGLVVEQMRSIAVEDASSHPGYRYFPETKEEQFHSYLGVPLAFRNRPVGAIVVQTKDRRSYTPEETATLSTIAAQLVGVVENARLIDALDRGKEGRQFIDELRSWHGPGSASKGLRQDLSLEGAAASAGIAMGEAVLRGSHELSADALGAPFRGVEEERRRLEQAMLKTREEILAIQEAAARSTDDDHALIFSSHVLLLNDQVLITRMHENIAAGETADKAAHSALEHFANRLQGVVDRYIQDRAEDIWDLRSRLVGNLAEKKPQGSSMSERIVVARGIAPSLVVELKAQGARAIVTERGGPTSHGALLARSMGLPAVTGIRDVSQIVRTGDHLIVDGDAGVVIVAPSRETYQRYDARAHDIESRKRSDLQFCSLPGRTRDGVRVALQANIAVTADLATARANGADGIGLYRTEFPFIIRAGFPTRDEQERIYARAYEYFPDGPVHFRLLDLGGDKILPGSTLGSGRTSFLGSRSIRILLDDPAILRDQVQAFLAAAGSRPLGILVPMVSSVSEFREVKQRIREIASSTGMASAAHLPAIGVMIELPAAVELAPELAQEADFLSIGSNDLIQYTLAADRENAGAARHANPYHPAVLRMIRRTIGAGHAAGKKVALCGELATRPPLTLALVAMGIDALSMTPGTIPELKRFLVGAEVNRLSREIDSLLGLSEAAEIEKALAAYVPGP
jgi:phosphotransferase system enzyme I (PtsP)